MLSSYDNRKVSQSIMSRGLRGLIVWWTAQVPQQQPADWDATDRAGSFDGNENRLVSGPRPPPTTINLIEEGRAHLDLLVVVCARTR